MNHNTEHAFPSAGEEEFFGREVLELAARMVAQGRRISLKSDVPFKLFLASDTRESKTCLRYFLSAVTGRKVRWASVRNPELLPDIVGKKKPRLDINCEFDGGQRADIELQLTRANDNQKVRALYYGSKLLAGTLKEGEDYRTVPFVYQIFLIDFDLFADRKFFHRAMMRLDDGTLLSDRLQILFFSLKDTADGLGEVDPSLKKAANWCKFIAGSTDEYVLAELGSKPEWREELVMAMRSYNKVTDEERAWAYHLSMDRAEADYKNELRLGIEKGVRRELRKKLKEARKEIEMEVQKEVQRAEKEETARKLLAMGVLTRGQIAQATGLGLEELDRIAADGQRAD
ncbi:MAG: Rpn family recombination-promoting nuclease/putative transposase [Treponema sp.]|nr:Rpn family recombination-promoting nuclease/putative transposase [Treponema sp.]